MSNASKFQKRWSRGQEFSVETVKIDRYTQARLTHYVKSLLLKPTAGSNLELTGNMHARR